jgi:hypothetical protein
MSDVELAISLPEVYQNPSERKHDENGAVLTPRTSAETVLCDIQNSLSLLNESGSLLHGLGFM